jgi:hypothetical protein
VKAQKGIYCREIAERRVGRESDSCRECVARKADLCRSFVQRVRHDARDTAKERDTPSYRISRKERTEKCTDERENRRNKERQKTILCRLFNNAASVSDYTASNGIVISK